MTIQEAIDARHSVRAYRNDPIEEDELREIPDRLEQKVRAETNLREAQR